VETSSWFEEMKRRRVFRALIGYGIVSFGVLQIIEPVMHGLNLPEWVLSAAVLGLGIGFPFTLLLAWIFDVKGGRIETTSPAPRARLLVLLVLAGLALATPGVAWYFWKMRRAPPAATAQTAASIAVLPFADLSPAKDQDWMCDGIAEEILDALFSVSGLRVAARSASFQFKGKTGDVRQMAQSLGVATLLEGSVRKGNDRLRVSARLVNSDGYEIWSDTFDRGVQDAFAIQEEIARAVVAALRLRVQEDATRRPGTQNPQAWEMYLRGRQYLRSQGHENLESARQMFKRAIALDAGFAQAHAGIADSDANLLQWLLPAKQEQPALRAEVLAESEKALELDPALTEAHVARGNVLSLLGRNEEADQSFKRAIELGPGSRDARYYYARFLFAAQRYPDAARAYEEAARLNPNDYDSLTLAAMPYERMGEMAKVRDAQRRALAAADRVLKNQPDDVRALYMSGGAMIALGDPKQGSERLEQAVTLRPHDYGVLYNAACGFTRAGNKARALDLLDRAVGTGQGFRAWFEHDPDLDALRGEPRFKEILARLPP
jgi:adenylate cyclase